MFNETHNQLDESMPVAGAMQSPGKRRKSAGAWTASPVERSGKSGRFVVQDKVDVIIQAAKDSGLLSGKDGRIGSRVSAKLISRAKAQTGIASDTQLIEFALASLALEDNFIEAFRKVRGKVDPELNLEF